MRNNHTSRHGITMAETIVSTLLVGMVLVGTIQVVGPTVRSGSVMADKLVASNLARELNEEISTKLFITPASDDDPDSLGPGGSETRATYDDIDDYHGVSNSPPQNSAGTPMTHLSVWSRVVKVVHVDLDDPSVESGSYTGLKRVTVTVSKDGVQLAQVMSLHSHSADQLGFVIQED